MGLKKQSKANAEFNMSSLTDIIFLLLIFFMLTSKMVSVDAEKLPESNSKTVAATSAIVTIKEDGTWQLDNEKVDRRSLKSKLKEKRKTSEDPKDFTITIVAEKDVPFMKVKDIMQIAGEMRCKAIIATKPKSS